MKRVNLIEYFELAEALHNAKRATSGSTNKGGTIWIGTWSLAGKLQDFVADDNGFSTSKRVAADLADTVSEFLNVNIMDGNSPAQFVPEKLDEEFHSWQYGQIASKIDIFKSVFAAECAEVDVYSVGQISIYRTSTLVARGSEILPPEVRITVPPEALKEFDDAGRCLAFDLPTACGFHALRGLELVMDSYLVAFDVATDGMRSWNDYIVAAKKLADDKTAAKRPSPKVAAMLDRMRELDRNPLMHPRDTLDEVSANMLFNLSAITAIEMVKDMSAVKSSVPLLANDVGGGKKGKAAA